MFKRIEIVVDEYSYYVIGKDDIHRVDNKSWNRDELSREVIKIIEQELGIG